MFKVTEPIGTAFDHLDFVVESLNHTKVHPALLTKWKSEAVNSLPEIFERGATKVKNHGLKPQAFSPVVLYNGKEACQG